MTPAWAAMHVLSIARNGIPEATLHLFQIMIHMDPIPMASGLTVFTHTKQVLEAIAERYIFPAPASIAMKPPALAFVQLALPTNGKKTVLC